MLTGWNNGSSCDDVCACSGGVARTALVKRCEITGVTLDGTGKVTAVTIATPGSFVEYGHENNNTSFYNQTGARPNGSCHEFTQEFLGEYSCFNDAAIAEANLLSLTRSVVAFHEMENGVMIVQGIDVYETSTPGTYAWKKSKEEAKTIIDIVGGTSAEESKVVLKINSKGAYGSATSSLTVTDLLAL